MDDIRLRCLFQNAHRLLKRRYSGLPLWSLVSDLTGYGSTVSGEICMRLNLDPHQDCKIKTLKNYV